MEAPVSRASNSRPKMTTVSRILRARCFAFLLVLAAREQLVPENDNCLEDCALICIFACSCGRAPTREQGAPTLMMMMMMMVSLMMMMMTMMILGILVFLSGCVGAKP